MVNSLQRWFNAKWVLYRPAIISHIRKYLWKTAVIFFAIFALLITLDLVAKEVVFNGDTSGAVGGVQADWGFIGFRSQFHKSTTFLDFIGASLPRYASLIIDYLLITIFTLLLIYNKNHYAAAAIAIALSGVIGNTIDATYFDGVRNVLFVPYAYRGVFNFADAYIIIGTPLIIISYFGEYIYSVYKARKAKKSGEFTDNLQVTTAAAPLPSNLPSSEIKATLTTPITKEVVKPLRLKSADASKRAKPKPEALKTAPALTAQKNRKPNAKRRAAQPKSKQLPDES